MKINDQSFAIEAQRIPMTSEDEYDWMTGWRHVLVKNHLRRKVVKRQYNRRWRKQARRWVKEQAA